MKRLFLLAVLLALSGCAAFDDFGAFVEPEPTSPCAERAVRACGTTGVIQTGIVLPVQTEEPPRR
jgi:hypothetical protein